MELTKRLGIPESRNTIRKHSSGVQILPSDNVRSMICLVTNKLIAPKNPSGHDWSISFSIH